MKKALNIELRDYSIKELLPVMKAEVILRLSDECRKATQDCRDYLDERLKNSNEAIYGINTGFGSLCDQQIDKKNIEQLQENLVKSHAAGTGKEIKPELVRLMLFLKILGLSKGYSGVRPALLDRMIDMYNQDVLPVVYEQGSLGASGDLAPLAHMSLPIIGTGEVNIKGQKLPGEALHQQFGWEPLILQSKEGIALLNGTQFMSAHAVYLLLEFEKLFEKGNQVAAISMDAFQARLAPFHPSLHKIRRHHGQVEVAGRIRKILNGSELQEVDVDYVQDPYSFRCIPQVHGAVWDRIQESKKVCENEINAVTDNPTIFPDEDLILSGGNFHGESIAMIMDFLKIAIHEFGSISERRTYKLLSGQRGLPAFLVAKPGINSGFMIAQYTSASLVSRSKALCFPSSVDTIDSSNGQEDHVSMGANAARACLQVLELVQQVVGIEYLTACQAIDFRTEAKSSPMVESLRSTLRNEAPFIKHDQVLHDPIQKAIALIKA